MCKYMHLHICTGRREKIKGYAHTPTIDYAYVETPDPHNMARAHHFGRATAAKHADPKAGLNSKERKGTMRSFSLAHEAGRYLCRTTTNIWPHAACICCVTQTHRQSPARTHVRTRVCRCKHLHKRAYVYVCMYIYIYVRA